VSAAPAILQRRVVRSEVERLIAGGTHPVLARIFAARGVDDLRWLETGLANLLSFEALKNVREMACILADAIAQAKRLVIVADYDCDGATACAVGVRALRAFGANVGYIVPNRFEYGYGLTPEIVRLAAKLDPDMLITVDNGIASVEGVNEANRLGVQVLITDHHLPGAALPDALCIVNPNQAGCDFPSKNLAGVGVMFYAMLALRAELRARGRFATRIEPNLGALLDLVALGTVADVVKLDRNNRILVDQGLRRIRAGKSSPGIRALYLVAGRDPRRATSDDLGFLLGPRLNAAGRLTDMSLGIECLIADDEARALHIARQLDALNRERRDIEANMQQAALAALDTADFGDACALCLYDPDWHQGVIGVLASRLKDRFHRPVIVFARASNGELKGSGRAIAGLHLRDALDLITKQRPGLVTKFGGHAAAAGVSIAEADFASFSAAFQSTVESLLSAADLEKVIETDGALPAHDIGWELANLIEAQVWGQGFPAPLFEDHFAVIEQRLIGDKHLKLRLSKDARMFDAMLFAQTEPLPETIHAVYRLALDEYQGLRTPRLTIEHWSG
jgi:single-stranded-DNA-specific exonuclease